MNSAKTHSVRTRMAPSPTGEMHVGSMATLLKNYAYAKKHDGQFVLRIEDTDQERLVTGAVDRLKKVIRDYGLDWDEGPDRGGPYEPYIQSQRLKIYQEKAHQLLNSGQAYYCFCSKERLKKLRAEQQTAKQPPKYDGQCRDLFTTEAQRKIEAGESYVIRLRVPANETIEFTDLIRGQIKVSSNEVDDQVLLKSDGYPTYHLAVVVDDHLMKISHVMRGEEWISSTPKRILLYQAFGWQPPIYVHIPVFLNPDGQGKMSKRKGTVSARSFLDRGFLPAAMLNFFMILGWASSDQREILSLAEYIQEFEPEDISANSVVFDLKKLRWMNGVYIRRLSLEQLAEKIKPFLPDDFPIDQQHQILPLVHERLETLADIEELTSFFYRPIKVDQAQLLTKADPALVKEQLLATTAQLSTLKEWNLDQIESAIRNLQADHHWKKGQYFMMLRQVMTGRKVSPPLFETIQVLGQRQALDRISEALKVVR